jgi:hypothetical protein
MTANQEVAPKRRHFRVGDNPETSWETGLKASMSIGLLSPVDLYTPLDRPRQKVGFGACLLAANWSSGNPDREDQVRSILRDTSSKLRSLAKN